MIIKNMKTWTSGEILLVENNLIQVYRRLEKRTLGRKKLDFLVPSYLLLSLVRVIFTGLWQDYITIFFQQFISLWNFLKEFIFQIFFYQGNSFSDFFFFWVNFFLGYLIFFNIIFFLNFFIENFVFKIFFFWENFYSGNLFFLIFLHGIFFLNFFYREIFVLQNLSFEEIFI